MTDFTSLQDLLSGGADVAIILFAYFLWKVDRRLLIVEEQIKTVFRKLNNGVSVSECPFHEEVVKERKGK